MKLSNKEILSWVEANQIDVTGSSDITERQSARSYIRALRYATVAEAIRKTFSIREEALEAELNLVRNGLGKTIKKKPTFDFETGVKILEDEGSIVGLNKFHEFGKENGYSPSLVSRIATNLARRYDASCGLIIVSIGPMEERGASWKKRYNESHGVNVPVLIDTYTSGFFDYLEGFGNTSQEFLSNFLEAWVYSNPNSDLPAVSAPSLS